MFDYKDFREDMVGRAKKERKLHSMSSMTINDALMAVYRELREMKDMMSSNDKEVTFSVTERDENGMIKSFRVK